MTSLLFDTEKKAYIEASSKRVQVEIGDSKDAAKFFPRVKLKAWENECNFSMGLATDGREIPTIEEVNGLIKWKASAVEAHFYVKEADAINEDGAYEFEVVLNEEPSSNIINLTTNIPKNLVFYYQGKLTEEEINEGHERPENVVGSYAVYHTSKAHNQYKTGKAFHIYRPEAVDAKGNKTWCDLNIDIKAQTATITIPQKYLDEASYPVYVDPTFGYTSTGGTSATTHNTLSAIRGVKGNPGENGTVTAIKVYGRKYYGTTYVRGGLYEVSNEFLLSPQSVEVTVNSGTAQWWTANVSSGPSVSNTDYWVCFFCYNPGGSYGYLYNFVFYFDNTSSGDGRGKDGPTYPTWPDPLDGVDKTYKISAYAEYTASESAPEGGSEARCNVSIEGSGKKIATGQSSGAVNLSAAGNGIKTVDGKSEVEITISPQGAGSKSGQAGSESKIAVDTDGQGMATITDGSEAPVVIDIDGTGITLRSEGSESQVNISTAGQGKRISDGSSEATISTTSVSFGAKIGSGSSDTYNKITTPRGSGRKIASGQSSGTVNISTDGSGIKTAAGSSEASIIISTEGSGQVVGFASGGSESSISVDAEASGVKQGRSPPANVSIIVPAEGAGFKTSQAGSEAAVIADTEGSGTGTKAGASQAQLSISGIGQGTKTNSGGSEVTVSITSASGGNKTGTGASETTIEISAQGAGTRQIQGGSQSIIELAASGTGTKNAVGYSQVEVTIATEGQGHPLERYIQLVASLSYQECLAAITVQERDVSLSTQETIASLEIQERSAALTVAERSCHMEVEILPLLNNTVRLKAEFRDFAGNLVSPDNVVLRIYDDRRNQIEEDIAVEPVSIGQYQYDYVVPADGLGALYYEFQGTVDGRPILGRAVLQRTWM